MDQTYVGIVDKVIGKTGELSRFTRRDHTGQGHHRIWEEQTGHSPKRQGSYQGRRQACPARSRAGGQENSLNNSTADS